MDGGGEGKKEEGKGEGSERAIAMSKGTGGLRDRLAVRYGALLLSEAAAHQHQAASGLLEAASPRPASNDRGSRHAAKLRIWRTVTSNTPLRDQII
ncbi:hypothetical protein TARUN_4182 [Trichoderma arundinaceum]|uniref:Uncharacterized protein n=1 Tax=Trichoderma arundinaceum TaxID=490622 RepID=A0A395NPP0_TRIAR|nr:hypothetical protein TARUN_4182 [Trichoderma arundinaceum]